MQQESGVISALRHGIPWRTFVGDNFVYFLTERVKELERRNEAAKNCLVCAAIWDAFEVCEASLAILDGKGTE